MIDMRYKKHCCASIWMKFVVGFVFSMPPCLGSAQDTGQPTGKENPSTQDASRKSDNANVEPASPIGLAWSDSYVRRIGTSGVLSGNKEGVGWRDLYISSAGVTGVVEQFEGLQAAPTATYTAAVLQATVVYDRRIGANRLAIQYQPSMAIAGGQVVNNFSNQNTSMDWLIYTRPRWNVRISDSFRYYYGQQTVGISYLDVNPTTSGLATNNFLDGPNRWLSNNAYISVAHAFSRRSSIEITPNYIFSEAGTGVNLARGSSYGGRVNWNYLTSERQTVGVQYAGQLLHESGPGISAMSKGAPTDSNFHSFAGTVARQLSATLFASGAVGATTVTLPQNARQWLVYGTFGLVKQVRRSSIGLNYSRGDTLSSGLISNQYADRVDLTLQSQITMRLDWSVGGGYLRQVQSGGFSAWYAHSHVQFLLAPRAGLFSTFDYYRKNQAVNANSLFIGNRNVYSFGLLWQPSREAQRQPSRGAH
jgi:hypothetical protein